MPYLARRYQDIPMPTRNHVGNCSHALGIRTKFLKDIA
jgi:hypothetical protein